ncbi:PD-(D/E)XK nuclease family protein [Candidatus Poribacteria bacterium]|nr:PD-(D/E)XK nuclease family protein [Candidatus Poribacteria bacterium]
MSGKQMALFEESEIQSGTESHKDIFSEWSYSRREMLEQCARKYYYQYYGSSLKKSNNDPQKENLHFSKNLQNRHLRTGSILHFVIRTYLNKLRRGEQWSLDRLLSWVRNIYREDIEYSRRYKRGTPLSDKKYPPTLLLEFYYGFPDAESLSTKAERRLIEALTNFVKSQNLEQFREGAGDTSAMIEKPIYLKEVHFTLRGTIDLAYWKGDRIVIVDWKIGSAGSSDDSLQMLAYAWWAKQEFKHPTNYITPCRVHLADNTVSTFNVSEKDLRRVEARILQDLERMWEADNYGRRALVEAFTPCTQPKICELCQFQEVCPKE